jgi:hypothetical protein
MMIIIEGLLFMLAGYIVVVLVLKAVELLQGDD